MSVTADEPFLSKLYQLLAMLEFNSERAEVLEAVLKEYLVTRNVSIDVPKEARRRWQDRRKHLKAVSRAAPDKTPEEHLKSQWFRQECLLSSNIPAEYIPEYLVGKFGPFEDIFYSSLGFDPDAVWMFSFRVTEYLEFKKHIVGFRNEPYRFRTKAEYADLGFVAVPGGDYVERFRNLVTLDIGETRRMLSGTIGRETVNAILETLSLNVDELSVDSGAIRLSLKPLLRLDENTIVILRPTYLVRGLPAVYEELAKRLKPYRDSKGTAFEELV